MARLLRVQSQQLLMESQVFEDEVLAGAESADHPPEEMPERQDHGKNLIGTIRIQLFAKSFILKAYDVLARHNPLTRQDRHERKDHLEIQDPPRQIGRLDMCRVSSRV
jgi:hypothetical protein